jgi:hypothetical protein
VVGQRVRISRVGHEDASVLDYLGEHELVPGRVLTVREVRVVDEVVAIEDEDGGPTTSEALWQLRSSYKAPPTRTTVRGNR